MSRRRALIGLGGNIGEVAAAMAGALQRFDARDDTRVEAVSRLYRTPPWGKTDQPWFTNACAAVATGLEARAFLDLCLETETVFMRERGERWGPRTLDIDVLDFAGLASSDARLTLPHPRIAERAFVLVPLAELAPDLLIAGERVADRAAGIAGEGIEPASADGRWWR